MAKANTKVVKTLGKRIDQLRKEREWSMREMADYCDIDKAQVNELTKDSIDFRYDSCQDCERLRDHRFGTFGFLIKAGR